MHRLLALVFLGLAVVVLFLPEVDGDAKAAYPKVYLPVVLDLLGAGLLPTTTVPPVVPTTTPTTVPVVTATPFPTLTTTPLPQATATALPTLTSTPLPRATATATPVVCSGSVQVLQNPSFESGWIGWSISSGAPVLSSLYASDGYYSVFLGGWDYRSDAFGTLAVVPTWAETGTIYFSWLMFSTDSTVYGVDSLGISLGDPTGQYSLTDYWVWNNGLRGSWVMMRSPNVNVRPYRGQVVPLVIVTRTDGMYPTGWYVDNVRLVFACGAAVPSAEVQWQVVSGVIP